MNKLLVTLFCAMLSFSCWAQNEENKLTDEERVSLYAFVPDQDEPMPEAAYSVLTNKMQQAIATNGMASTDYFNQFVMVPHVTIYEKSVIPGTRPVVQIEIELTLYVGDAVTGKVYGQCSKNLKAAQPSEQKAFVAALKSLNARDPQIAKLIGESKQQIIAYYNTQIDFIIKEAETLAAQNECEAAIAKLVAVPQVCKVAYERAMDAVAPIYQQMIDRESQKKLIEATSLWNSSQDVYTARKVAEILATIDPAASCLSEVAALWDKVGKRVKALDEREWQAMERERERSYDLEKRNIQAIRDIGVAYGKNQKATTYNVIWW